MPSINPAGWGPYKMGTLTSTNTVPSTSWLELPGAFKTFGVSAILSGSTAAVTGTVLLKGKIGADSTASITVCSWSSTLGSSVPKASTTSIPVTHLQASSTNLASTGSTAASPQAVVWIAATP